MNGITEIFRLFKARVTCDFLLQIRMLGAKRYNESDVHTYEMNHSFFKSKIKSVNESISRHI